jgi:DNA polymerase-3 subunit chi
MAAAVAFHFGMADRLAYSCRLLRKASRAGARVVVAGEAATLDQLDRLLWVFDPLEFVPHWRGTRAAAMAPRLAGTPVVLVDQVPQPPGSYDVLLNLGDEVPAGFEAFARVIEVVAPEDEARALARQRWRHYAGQGLAIERHEVRS